MKTLKPTLFLLSVLAFSSLSSTNAHALEAECAPNVKADQFSPIVLETDAKLVSHTVVFEVSIPAAEFNQKLIAAPLSELLPGTAKIPAVTGTRSLSSTPFGTVGAPRVVCLADASTAIEEVIENTPGTRFRYKVGHYSSDVAKPIAYGIGEFQTDAIDVGHTRVTWTYWFKLHDDRFPGYLGGTGRWLFRISFMESDYAEMMQTSARAMTKYFK